ncbi:MAG: MotA/TolQ/ExbB proton channel family protein [Alphaproteobacteria bacterium]|nr:MotA/TolQ/ExbB proton channel family protein [Alphaproteobacteria bacterium]MDE2112388.1 MotA/TolQ/ExbB proton channel family protein [Alphaproteobacteria bacterium]MDE2495313.1 MotA/TolQ/ExbB proton channel family protein [Alphaproteobacteria bacterium]
MISKHLTIAAAFVLLTGFAVVPAMAQATAPAPATTTAAPAAPAAEPGPTIIKAPTAATAPTENPYGLQDMLKRGGAVTYGVLGILLVMSVGTWYIFFLKWFDQNRILGQARTVERRFWTSSSLNEGIDKLPKNSLFRMIAEAGVKASQGGTSLVSLNDWIAMSLARQLDDATASLQGGVAFLASVGSVAPFVGLFGTVWGILQALIAIGVAGQASIGKVAGPVGEALTMTALGLAAAVPAVLLYNYLVRRNKVITEKLRGFAGDLQTYLISKAK